MMSFFIRQLPHWLLYTLITVSVLWRGGKSLEMTWFWAGCMGAMFLFSCVQCFQKDSKKNSGMPLWLWCTGVAFVSWTLLSFLFSTTLNNGFDEVVRTLLGVLLFFWIARNRHDEFIQKILGLVAWLTIAACVIGVLVYVFQPVNRFVGTFFDHRYHTDYWPNAWGEYLLMTWPVVYYWFTRKDISCKWKVTSFLAVGFVIGSLLLSYSRGSVMALGGQIALWGLLTVALNTSAKQLQRVALQSVAIISISVMVFVGCNALRAQTHTVQSIGEKVTFTAAEGNSSINERQQFWNDSWQLTLRRPWFGWGPYSFKDVHTVYQDHVLATADHPHNIFLKLSSERGAPAAVLFLVLIGSIVLYAVGSIIRERLPTNVAQYIDESADYSPALIVAIAGVMAHLMIDYNLQFIGITVLFWLFVGMLTPKAEALPRTWLVETVLLVIVFLACVREGAYLGYTKLGQHYEATTDYGRALAWYDRAEHSWYSRSLHYIRFTHHFLRKEYDQALAAIDTQFSLNNQDHRVWKHHAEFAYYQGQYQEALPLYQEAFRRGRYNDLQITIGLLRTLIELNNEQELNALKPEIDDLTEKYRLAFVRNSHYISLSQNVEAFKDLLKILTELYPDKGPHYDVLAANVTRYAEEARAELGARPPGYLW